MDQAVDCFISWRRCAGGHGQAGLSKRYKANARGSKARSCPLGIVATRGYSSWLRRKKDRSPAVGSSARRFSISRTELSAPQSRGRMAIRACVSFTGFISQDQLRDIFYASHIFLHPSETGRDGNQEGIPNSMLEAMASGLPVFATQH